MTTADWIMLAVMLLSLIGAAETGRRHARGDYEEASKALSDLRAALVEGMNAAIDRLGNLIDYCAKRFAK